MVFEKNGRQVTLIDPVHIDAFKANGWTEKTAKAEVAKEGVGEKPAPKRGRTPKK